MSNYKKMGLLFIHTFLLGIVGSSSYNRFRYFDYNLNSIEVAFSGYEMFIAFLGATSFILIFHFFVRKVFEDQGTFKFVNKFLGIFVVVGLVIPLLFYQAFAFHDYFLISSLKFQIVIFILFAFESFLFFKLRGLDKRVEHKR